MLFDTGLIKQHPYATGGIVIVGALLVFYLMSSGEPTASATTTSGGTATSDPQFAQIAAAAQLQQQQIQADLQTASINAASAQYQTDAAVSVSNTTTAAQLAASLAQIAAGTTQNRDAIQGNVILSSMATDVAKGQQYTDYLTTLSNNDVATHAIDTAASIQQTQMAYQQNLSQQVFNNVSTTGLAYTPNRDNLNSTTSIFQTILAGGNPSVATAGLTSTTQSQTSGDAKTASNVKAVTGGITSILSGLFS